MKRFLTNLLILLALLCLALTAIVSLDFLVFRNQYTQAYTGSILDKTARLQSIQEPKIILVGNSNLSFGMNSGKIEEELGMPVVNLGLHGGLGNAFHEEMAKLGIREGDIVVICHSDYENNEIPQPTLAWVTLEKHTELWKILRPEDLAKVLRAYPDYFLNVAKNWLSRSDVPLSGTSYARSAFNEYGDIAVRPDQDSVQHEFYEGSITVPPIEEACIRRLNDFHAYVQSRGATMLVSYYPIAQGEFTPAEEEYLAFQSELTAQLDCEIISDIRDYFIPYEYFYDTVYHLDDNGVEIRTNQLISDLSNWLSKNSP